MDKVLRWIKIGLLIIGVFVVLDFLFDYQNGVITMDFKDILNKFFN